jgi:hypothetical protein
VTVNYIFEHHHEHHYHHHHHHHHPHDQHQYYQQQVNNMEETHSRINKEKDIVPDMTAIHRPVGPADRRPADDVSLFYSIIFTSTTAFDIIL